MPRCFLMFFFRCLFAMFAFGLELLQASSRLPHARAREALQCCRILGCQRTKQANSLPSKNAFCFACPKIINTTHHAKHGDFFIFWTMEFRRFSQLFGTPQHKRGFLNGDLQIIHVHNGFFVVNHPFGGMIRSGVERLAPSWRNTMPGAVGPSAPADVAGGVLKIGSTWE